MGGDELRHDPGMVASSSFAMEAATPTDKGECVAAEGCAELRLQQWQQHLLQFDGNGFGGVST